MKYLVTCQFVNSKCTTIYEPKELSEQEDPARHFLMAMRHSRALRIEGDPAVVVQCNKVVYVSFKELKDTDAKEAQTTKDKTT